MLATAHSSSERKIANGYSYVAQQFSVDCFGSLEFVGVLSSINIRPGCVV